MEIKEFSKHLGEYKKDLKLKELAPNTIKKYMFDIEQFIKYLNKKQIKDIDKQDLIDYKGQLKDKYKISTTNSKLISLNVYLKYLGLEDWTLKQLKEQSTVPNNLMQQSDYNRILRQAKQKGNDRDVLMLQALYLTGLRVSELRFLTVKSLEDGYITVSNKGKTRLVPITNKLKSLAVAYIDEHDIKDGPIIRNKNGQSLSRIYIYRRIQYLAGQARVSLKKAHPHNIRHLFAKQWVKRNNGNITQLADILGHANLETTRIYLRLTVDEARKTMS